MQLTKKNLLLEVEEIKKRDQLNKQEREQQEKQLQEQEKQRQEKLKVITNKKRKLETSYEFLFQRMLHHNLGKQQNFDIKMVSGIHIQVVMASFRQFAAQTLQSVVHDLLFSSE